MENQERIDAALECAAGVLIRSFFMGVALLLIWFLLFAFATDWMYRMQSQWFVMSRDFFYAVNYGGIGFLKLCIIVFFLLPYLSIRMVLRSRKKRG